MQSNGRRQLLVGGAVLMMSPGGPYEAETERAAATPELTAAGLISLLQEVAPDTPIMLSPDGVIMRAATTTTPTSIVGACAQGYYQHDPTGTPALIIR